MILSSDCHSHCAGGLVLFCTASSKYGGDCSVGFASSGVEVMVKPPAFGRPGMKVSSHCPGRNFSSLQSFYATKLFFARSRPNLDGVSGILGIQPEHPDAFIDFLNVC